MKLSIVQAYAWRDKQEYWENLTDFQVYLSKHFWLDNWQDPAIYAGPNADTLGPLQAGNQQCEKLIADYEDMKNGGSNPEQIEEEAQETFQLYKMQEYCGDMI